MTHVQPRRRFLLLRVPVSMLVHDRWRFVATVAALAITYLLCGTQLGLLVGWSNTTSAIVTHAGAHFWLVASRTPAFDYGTAIPRQRLYQARSVEGVASADAVYMGWNFWQRSDGRRVNVEVIGFDADVPPVPWSMEAGTPGVIHEPKTVIVDRLYADQLGVERVGDEVEIAGRRAIVGGFSQGVRTFTAAPFVFASLETALDYDLRMRRDEITYVLVRVAPDAALVDVRRRLERLVPGVEVLSTDEFAARTIRHWMLETGAGITVVLAAALGVVIAIVVASQTLVSVTRDNLASYATLLAVGVARGELLGGVLVQAALLTLGGDILGSLLLALAIRATERAPIPIEARADAFVLFTVLTFVFGALAATASCRLLLRVDPSDSFRAT